MRCYATSNLPVVILVDSIGERIVSDTARYDAAKRNMAKNNCVKALKNNQIKNCKQVFVLKAQFASEWRK